LSKLEVNKDASNFRLLDQALFSAITQCREAMYFSRGFVVWAGFLPWFQFYHAACVARRRKPSGVVASCGTMPSMASANCRRIYIEAKCRPLSKTPLAI
jgi:hypothetical protein